MANRKPIPKTQKEISKNLQKPYDAIRGNANISSNPNESETGIQFNRSEKLSFKGDTTKPFKIGIQVHPKGGNHFKKMVTIEIKREQ